MSNRTDAERCDAVGSESLDRMKYGDSVKCTVCGLTKAPRGRSVAPEMAASLCGYDCTGYMEDPQAGSLFPNESEADFGYPVGSAGVRFVTEEERVRIQGRQW